MIDHRRNDLNDRTSESLQSLTGPTTHLSSSVPAIDRIQKDADIILLQEIHIYQSMPTKDSKTDKKQILLH
jgi:hypothetical protein